MQIILLQRVQKLGQMGQVVDVKPGYARNYLLPQKKALRATKENLSYFEKQKAHLEAHNLKLKAEAEHAAKTMENVMVSLVRQASEMGHLYGSVRSNDIATALELQNIKVMRTQVELINPIKTLGIHAARINLHPEVHVTIKVNVALSDEEAAVQAESH